MYRIIIKSLPQLLILGAFGPFLILNFGLRTEQVMSYGLFILIFLKLISSHRVKLDRVTFSIALTWIGIIFLSILASFAVSNTYAPTLMEFFAGIDNKLMPLCILLAVGVWQLNQIKRQGINSLRDTLSQCALLLSYMLFVNTLFSLTMGLKIPFDVNAFLAHFWTPTFSEEFIDSVAARAFTMGRQTGIFNQPFEAGVMYSIGLILCIYRYRILEQMNWRDILLFTFIIIGGIVSLSKVFIIVGILLGIIYFLRRVKFHQLIGRSYVVCIVMVSAYFLIINISSEIWIGIDILRQLLMIDVRTTDSILAFFSGGRFDTGLMSAFFSTVWNISPFLGVGFGSVGWPMDNSYFDMYKHGGIPALMLYIILIAKLMHYSFKSSFVHNFPEEARLLRYLMILLVVAGFGAPAFTVNRVATIVWLLIGLLLPCVSLKALIQEPRFNAMVRLESSV